MNSGKADSELELRGAKSLVLFLAFSFASLSVYYAELTLLPRTPTTILLTGVSLGIGAIASWFLHKGMIDLRGVDDSRFTRPADLTRLLPLGLVLALAAFSWFDLLGSAYSQSPGSIDYAYVLEFLAGALVLISSVAIIFAGLVGFLLGFWRIGKRFKNGVLRFAPFFVLVPYVNLAALILLILELNSLRKTESI